MRAWLRKKRKLSVLSVAALWTKQFQAKMKLIDISVSIAKE